jgi:hypothetical protein
LLNHAIDKFVDLTSEVWKGFNRNARLYNSSGEDSIPCKEDQIILVKIDGTGKYIAAGVLTVSQGAKPGEKILYARDSDAKIVSKISMLNDGAVKIEADGDIEVIGKKNVTIDATEKSTIKGSDIEIIGKKNITIDATEKSTIKGSDIEIKGNTKLTGGTLECSGTANPTGTGCWCAKPFCTWDGSPHVGNKATGT